MLTETQRTRQAFLRASKTIRRKHRFAPNILSAVRKRHFPLGFFIRNILALEREPGWKRLSPRIWKGHLRRMLEERSRIFLEVNQWRSHQSRNEEGLLQTLPPSPDTIDPSGYCSHCGGCCEIASGLPDFPGDTVIPRRWQELFGKGLGKGHRFCAFLWEINGSGLSVCAIHPWRAAPCRTFEEAECAFFMHDLEVNPPFLPQDFSMACRCLSRLINRR